MTALLFFMSLEFNLDFITDKAKKSNIKKALAILERSYYKNIEESSFFLDPYEQDIIRSIAIKNGIDISFIGGNDLAERKIFVANYYYLPLVEENYISILSFKQNSLSHPDVLGALMSLDIDRTKVGDIVIADDFCEFAILKDEANFVKYNLTKIKREGIDIEIKNQAHLDIIEDEFDQFSGFVSSLRLDNLISLFLNRSRSKAKDIINNKNVKVNYELIDDPGKTIDEGAMISIRKEGRFIFDEITGSSKKGNLHINYRKLKWYIF